MSLRSASHVTRAFCTGQEKINIEFRIPHRVKTVLETSRIFMLKHWYRWDKMQLWKFNHENPWTPAEAMAGCGFAFGGIFGALLGSKLLYRYDESKPAWMAVLATFAYIPAHAALTAGCGFAAAFVGLHAPFFSFVGVPFACIQFASSFNEKKSK
jgi:hypothetical protein